MKPRDAIAVCILAPALACGCEPATKQPLIVDLTTEQLATVDPSSRCVMYAIRDVGDKQEVWHDGKLFEVREVGETKQAGMAFVGHSPVGDIGDYGCDQWWRELSR